MIHTLTFLFVAVNLHFISSNLVVDRRGYRLYETIQRLNNQCFDYTNSLSADVYRWCFGQNATITRVDKENSKSNVHVLDRRLSLNTINPSVEIFHSTSADCFNGESYIEHSALINLQCCDTAGEGGNYLRFVHERLPCTYTFELCVESVCRIDDAIEETEQRAPGQQIVETSELTSLPPEEIIHAPVEQRPQHQRDPYASPRPSLGAVSKEDQLKLREEVREMFYHGYRGYMSLAYPASELKPIECTAGLFDLVKIPFVTLIDALDTLVIMGDYAEFRHAVSMLERDLQNFAFDVNVSLFETTIRVLGGLLAAHLMAVDPKLHIYDPARTSTAYNGHLLRLAADLGDRLIPAFSTATGIPYGTVNLMRGVPVGETMISSTAASGTLMLEFEILSCLTGDDRYGNAASEATKAFYFRRSPIGLLGKHINITTGKWTEPISGIGSNSDSYYEYLLKSYLLFNRAEYFRMFTDAYSSIKHHVQVGKWFLDVDMFNGKFRDTRIENLQAFWPGMEATMGFTDSSADVLNALYDVWLDLGILPEDLNVGLWSPGKTSKMLYNEWRKERGLHKTQRTAESVAAAARKQRREAILNQHAPFAHQTANLRYLLRPELIESTYHHYRATGDRSWLNAGAWFLRSIEDNAKTPCGYASISSASHEPMLLEDSMPSFFLSETCKYLYLLFDEDNFIHNAPYVFSTEAHPFDTTQLQLLDRKRYTAEEQMDWFSESHHRLVSTGKPVHVSMTSRYEKSEYAMYFAAHGHSNKHEGRVGMGSGKKIGTEWLLGPNISPLLPLRCHRKDWWEVGTTSFSPSLLTNVAPLIEDDGGVVTDHSGAQPQDAFSVESLTAVIERDLKLVGFPAQIVLNRIKQVRSREERKRGIYDVEKDLVRLNKCPRSEEKAQGKSGSGASHGGSGSAGGSGQTPNGFAAPEEPKLNSPMNVDLGGALGEFTINVLPSRFVVQSARYGNSLDISNLGQPLVIAKETRPETQERILFDKEEEEVVMVEKDVMADAGGSVIQCTVGIHNRTGLLHAIRELRDSATPARMDHAQLPPAPGNNASVDYAHKVERDLRDRTCSVAAFDLVSSEIRSIGVKPFHIIAEPINSPDIELCQDPAKAKLSNWWNWRSSQGDAPNKKVFADKIAVAKRGNCMFEDKAIHAKNNGASGLLIHNNEDELFLMRGKSDRPEASPSPVKDFPTVMVARSDYSDLSRALAWMQMQKQEAQLEIIVSNVPMILNSEYMGNFDYPKISLSDKLVIVQSNAPWGVVLSLTQSQVWQLFILPKTDVNTLSPFKMRTANGHEVSMNPQMSANRVEWYSQYLRQKCNNNIAVSSTGTVSMKRPRKTSSRSR